MLTLDRFLTYTPILLLMLTSTAVAQDWTQELTQELTPEFQFGAVVGGGWYDVSVASYRDDLTLVSNGNGMGLTFGATTRVGLSTRGPSVGLMLAFQGDLMTATDTHERYLLADVSGFFGVKIPVFLDGRSSVLLGGLLGIGFTNNDTVDGSGVSYGAIAQYRFDHLFMEARYQRWVFDANNGVPQIDADLTIHQLLGSVGLAL